MTSHLLYLVKNNNMIRSKGTPLNKKYKFSLVIPTITPENISVAVLKYNELYTFNSVIENGGFDNQEVVLTFEGFFNTTQPIKVANIKILPSSGNKILDLPSINIENKYKRTTIDNNTELYLEQTSTSDVYALFLNSKKIFSSGIKFNLNYTEFLSDKNSLIESLNFGGNIIKAVGENREIEVIGAPHTPFELTLVDSDGNSTLPESVSNSTTTLSDGSVVPCISSSTNSSGVYSFEYYFPRIPRVIKTAINGSMAVSGASKIIFDDLTGVEVGDQIFTKSITKNKAVKVITLNPDGDNVNECTLSESITAADDVVVDFRRSRQYNLNITSTSGLSASIPTTNPTYILNQNTDTIFKLRLNKTLTNYTISDGTKTSSASDTSFDIIFSAISGYVDKNKTNRYKETVSSEHSVELVFNIHGGRSTFNLLKTPVFNTNEFAISDRASDFTNANTSKNGGSIFNISNISAELSSANSVCTILFDLRINKFGTQDITVELDLDNILS